MNLGESDWLLIQKECSNLAKKARISGFRLWIIPELSILLLKIAGSGYEIGFARDLYTCQRSFISDYICYMYMFMFM